MPANTKIYWLHALTPLHVGSGRGVGFIDLPIMREKVTKWPLVPGSAVKGVVADHFGATEDERKNDALLKAAFGISGNEYSNSGSLVFTDARLVCLPVRSLYGTFAWVTSPLALRRLKRDLDAVGLSSDLSQALETLAVQDLLCPQLATSALRDDSNRAYFEDLDFTARESSAAKTWADKLGAWVFPGDPIWQEEFRRRFAVIPDSSFDFLCETGTEVSNSRYELVWIDVELGTGKDEAVERVFELEVVQNTAKMSTVLDMNPGKWRSKARLSEHFC